MTTMPADVVIEVLLKTDIHGFQAFRATCRRLYQISKERSVWVHLIELMKASNSLLGSTVQFADLTPDQMEFFYSKPFRFTQVLQQTVAAPMSMTTLQSALPYKPIPMCTVKLIPGGRFMLTGDRDGWIRCYDIGIGLGPIQIPLDLARIQVGNESVHDLTITKFSENETLILSKSWIDESTEKERLDLTCLNVSPLAIGFTRLGFLPAEFTICPFSVSLAPSMIAIGTAALLTFWDWRNDRWRAINRRHDPDSGLSPEVKLMSTRLLVVAYDQKEFQVFEIPGLLTRSGTECEPPTINQRPILVVPFDGQLVDARFPDRWHEPLCTRIDSLYLLSHKRDTTTVLHFELPPSCQGGDLWPIPRLIETIGGFTNCFKLLGCSPRRKLFLRADRGLMAHIPKQDANTKPEARTLMDQVPAGGSSFDDFDCCDISGRVCVLTHTGLHILDYCLPS